MPVTHILLFALSAALMWFMSGLLIDATERVARRFNRPGFAVAFFVLGILTSISEISVAINATAEGVPQVSAGNLIGASLVIFLFIMPTLAVFGNGIPMTRAMTKTNIIILLCVVLLPALMTIDGRANFSDGVLLLLFYLMLIFRLQKKRKIEKTARDALRKTEKILLRRRHATISDIAKIVLGAVLIFIAGNILVNESIYFANMFSIPSSFIGLLLLSIGTNIPELVIALRCILGRHKDIAFGDYMGSAVANTLIFALLILANGAFAVEQSESLLSFPILTLGLTLFYFFSRTRGNLSRVEGLALLSLYAFFLFLQISNAIRLSGSELPLEAEHAPYEQRQTADLLGL
jgi:cation:H+ antiporter